MGVLELMTRLDFPDLRSAKTCCTARCEVSSVCGVGSGKGRSEGKIIATV